MGGMRRPVLPSIPCTSLPQMPQAMTRTSTSAAPTSGERDVLNLELPVGLENQGFHGVILL